MIQTNISLKPYNSFGISVFTKKFASFNSIEQLSEIININAASNDKTIVIGGGSNILFLRDFDGLVLKNEISGIEIVDEDNLYKYVKIGSGVEWHKFVLFCIENNLAGVENLSLIPGSVGAGPMQNIGAYGVEIKDVFHSLEAWHINDKAMQSFSNKDCEFEYRESIFKKKYKGQFVIYSVTIRLNKLAKVNVSYGAIETELAKMGIKESSIKDVSNAVINIRKSKLPNPEEIGNAGSFFKNPVISFDAYQALLKNFPDAVAYELADNNYKIAAGWLVEKCGWKGYREGDAGCHAKQALVLINYGNASGRQIFELSEKIMESVKTKFGIQLQREVNLL